MHLVGLSAWPSTISFCASRTQQAGITNTECCNQRGAPGRGITPEEPGGPFSALLKKDVKTRCMFMEGHGNEDGAPHRSGQTLCESTLDQICSDPFSGSSVGPQCGRGVLLSHSRQLKSQCHTRAGVPYVGHFLGDPCGHRQ